MSHRIQSIVLIAFGLLVGVSKWRIDQSFPWEFPLVDQLVVTEHYLEDVGSLLLGARRFAADTAYVQLLQYYGAEEAPGVFDVRGVIPGMPAGFYDETRVGTYARLKEFGIRILRLDPFFNGAALEVAGALAFNQRRIKEALDLLKEAIQRDPSYFRYHLYVSAILYKEKGDELNLMSTLEQASRSRDCPVLLLGILGNLFKKHGYYEKAAQMYLRMMDASHSSKDQEDGKRRLRRLIEEHPHVLKGIDVPT